MLPCNHDGWCPLSHTSPVTPRCAQRSQTHLSDRSLPGWMQQSLRKSWLFQLQAWRASLLLQISSVLGVWYASVHGAPFFRWWKNKQGEEGLGRTGFFEKKTRTNTQVPNVAFIPSRDKLPFCSPKLSFSSRGFEREHLTSTSDNVLPRKCATQERWATECGKDICWTRPWQLSGPRRCCCQGILLATSRQMVKSLSKRTNSSTGKPQKPCSL